MLAAHHRRRLARKRAHEGRHGAAAAAAAEGLPRGVRILAWARAVRWIGWGFGEALIPVFILAFSKSFAETGLFSATVDIVSLVSLPIIGAWADKMPARRLVLWSLALYPLVGVSYFFAGLWGMAIFIVIARGVNGFTFELENVGIETYYRRVTATGKIASSFGYIETWSHVAWISAALAGMALVRFIPVHWLLLAIAPFSIIACIMAARVPDDGHVSATPRLQTRMLGSYGSTVKEVRSWSSRMWLLSALGLFASVVSSLVFFFVPIDAYIGGANLPMVVLITVVGAVPALFGYKLGRLVDAGNKYIFIAGGLFFVAAIATGLYLVQAYWFKLVAMFLIGIILELFYVAEGSLVTTLGPEESYGERGSAYEGIAVLGDMVAPLILGIGLDAAGFGNVALAIGGAAFLLAIVYRVVGEATAQ